MTQANMHFFKKSNVDEQAWPVDANMSENILAESFVYYDTSKKFIRNQISDTNAANFLGLCMDAVPIQNYGSNFTFGGGSANPNGSRNSAQVERYGQAAMFVTSGQNYTAGAALYQGADPQTVTTVVGSHQLAYVSGEQADITNAVSGTKVLVDFRANYPALPIN